MMMIKKILLLLITFLSFYTAKAQHPNLDWVTVLTGDYELNVGLSMDTDHAGNVYTTGTFYGTIDLESESNNNSYEHWNADNIFIEKLDPNGNFIWGKAMESQNGARGETIRVDGEGNIYVVGFFAGNTDMDPGPGVTMIRGEGWGDIFLFKLSANGDLLWRKIIGSMEERERARDLEIDSQGNVYITGEFEGTTDFDPGPEVYELSPSDTRDAFLLKLDSDGNFIWVKAFGSEGYAIELDHLNNIFVSGVFYGTVDMDPGPEVYELTNNNHDNIFILKLDPNGDFLWVNTIGGEGNDIAIALAIDPLGDVYYGGLFYETVDFTPGTGNNTFTSNGEQDIFIQKLSSAGDPIWTQVFGGPANDQVTEMTFNQEGHLCIALAYDGTIDFDAGPGVQNFTSKGLSDILYLKLHKDGSFIYGGSIGGFGLDYARGLHVKNDEVYLSGLYSFTGDFQPGEEVFSVPSLGGGDIFILKFSEALTSAPTVFNDQQITLFPNPVADILKIDMGKLYNEIDLKITNILGQDVHQQGFANQLELDVRIQNLTTGIYFINFQMDDLQEVISFIKD